MSEPARPTERTAAALAARRRDTHAALERVRDAITGLHRDKTPVSVAAVARRANVSRTFLYTNVDAKTAVGEAIQKSGQQRSRLRAEADDTREATWRERALNAEDALKAAHAEIGVQRTRIGELLGRIRDLEADCTPDDVARITHRKHHPQTACPPAQRRQPHPRRTTQSRPLQPAFPRPPHRRPGSTADRAGESRPGHGPSMTIPDFQTLMRPILAYLADGQQKSTRSVIAAMSEAFGLTTGERVQMIPSGGRANLIDNRIGWSLTELSQGGVIERPVRARVKITPTGLHVLRSHPNRVDMSVLRNDPAYREFRDRSRAKQPDDSAASDIGDPGDAFSPEDLIDAVVAENRAAVEGDILKTALALSATGFENLVSRFLKRWAMGVPDPSSAPGPLVTRVSTASSARTRSDSTFASGRLGPFWYERNR